jgi:hypothetical protein
MLSSARRRGGTTRSRGLHVTRANVVVRDTGFDCADAAMDGAVRRHVASLTAQLTDRAGRQPAAAPTRRESTSSGSSAGRSVSS